MCKARFRSGDPSLRWWRGWSQWWDQKCWVWPVRGSDVIFFKWCCDQSLEERSIFSPKQITKLVEVCLKTTYFVYNSEYFEQLEGAAMGSPVSPIVANISWSISRRSH